MQITVYILLIYGVMGFNNIFQQQYYYQNYYKNAGL